MQQNQTDLFILSFLKHLTLNIIKAIPKGIVLFAHIIVMTYIGFLGYNPVGGFIMGMLATIIYWPLLFFVIFPLWENSVKKAKKETGSPHSSTAEEVEEYNPYI